MTRPAPKLRDRLKALLRKRATLKARIADELSRPAPDTIRLRTMKRLRVRIKDQVNLILRQIRLANTGSTGNAA